MEIDKQGEQSVSNLKKSKTNYSKKLQLKDTINTGNSSSIFIENQLFFATSSSSKFISFIIVLKQIPEEPMERNEISEEHTNYRVQKKSSISNKTDSSNKTESSNKARRATDIASIEPNTQGISNDTIYTAIQLNTPINESKEERYTGINQTVELSSDEGDVY